MPGLTHFYIFINRISLHRLYSDFKVHRLRINSVNENKLINIHTHTHTHTHTQVINAQSY